MKTHSYTPIKASLISIVAIFGLASGGCDDSPPDEQGAAGFNTGKADANGDQVEDEAILATEACSLALEEIAEQEDRDWTPEDAGALEECEGIEVTNDVELGDATDLDKETTYIAYSTCRNMCVTMSRTAYQESTRSGYGATHSEAKIDAQVEAEFAVEELAYAACGYGGVSLGCASWIAN